MMMKRNFENRIRHILQDLLKEFEFYEKERLFFIKDENEIVRTLAFGGRVDSKVNRFVFSGIAGICFLEIEKIYRPELLNDITPTIIIPLHLLHDDRHYFEWSLGENESEIELLNIIKHEIQVFAMPFFMKFSNIDILRKQLESLKPDDWFVLNPDQRICILGIIKFIKGDSKKALEILNNALEERKDALPKRKIDLERVYKRILKLSNQP